MPRPKLPPLTRGFTAKTDVQRPGPGIRRQRLFGFCVVGPAPATSLRYPDLRKPGEARALSARIPGRREPGA
jgi:hypothetical protein